MKPSVKKLVIGIAVAALVTRAISTQPPSETLAWKEKWLCKQMHRTTALMKDLLKNTRE